MTDYRKNRHWALTHLRSTGDNAYCGAHPGEPLLVDRWDDFTCPACLTAWETQILDEDERAAR